MGSNAAAVVLLVTDVDVLPATAVVWTMQEFPEPTASGKSLSILTQASRLGGKLPLDSSSVDVLVSVAETPGHHSFAWLTEVSRTLKPGGVLVVQEPLAKREISQEDSQVLGQSVSTIQTETSLKKALLLAGFTGSKTVGVVNGVGLAPGFSNATQLFDSVALKVTKPAWETGSSFSLKKKAVVKPNGVNGKVTLSDISDFNINVSPSTNGVVSWKVQEVDLDNDELVDEDSLLTEEDLKKPEVSTADDDCEVGQKGRKACANCTCGRAELEDDTAQPETKLTLGQINNPQSACGSCGLGDAFRCNGCPYKGLPAFKLGEKISLSGSLLTADV
ncbi:unnamed protein product [Calypogeia fissa]